MKTIYLDIMIKGSFYTQLAYQYWPIFPPTEEDLVNYCIEKRPSLKYKKFKIEFSNNRIIK